MNNISEARTAKQLAQRLGISPKTLYQLWDKASRELGIPAPGSMRAEDARALEQFALTHCVKAKQNAKSR